MTGTSARVHSGEEPRSIGKVSDRRLAPGVGEAFATASFTRQPSLPNARLTLSGGEDAYLASLSPAARRDVRRKLKGPSLVRVEERRGQAALELVPQIVALYEAQRNRSGVDFDQFETLTPAYFRGVLERLGDTAVVFVYLHDEKPVVGPTGPPWLVALWTKSGWPTTTSAAAPLVVGTRL